MKRLIPLLLASTFLYTPATVHAEPISTAIGLTAIIAEGLAVSTATAGVIGGAILSAGVAVGSTLASRYFPAKPAEAAQTDKGTQTQASIGADVPRNRVYGKQAIAGRLGYWNVFGPDNIFLELRYDLGTGPHAFFGMFANGKRCTLGAELPGWGLAITDFQFAGVDTAWLRFHDGQYDQAIDSSLVSNAVPPGRYASTNVGRGCCYAVVTLGYKPESYPQGVPQFQFEIGALLYDPRKDGSTGGSGAHRWSDQHTWEWSDNPAIALYEYERGLHIGTHRVIGRGLAPVDILRGAFIDAANICDEVVTLKSGGTERRYGIGMNVGADRELKSVEADFCTTFAGALIEQAGAYGPVAGVAQDVVATFSDDDLIQGKPIRFSQYRPRDQLVNALFGSYSEPAQNYQAIPYAPRTSSADEASDGGERFAARRDYVQILSQTQAQRVGEIDRREGRYQGTGAVTLGFKFSYLEAGDWVRWISARRGFDKLFRVTQHRLGPDQTISLSLDETATAVFDFDPDIDELDPLAPGDLPGIGALLGTVPDLEAEAVQLVDASTGLKAPAIRALWSPITDRTVDRVRLQYRLVSQPDAVHDSDPFPPDDGEGMMAAGIQAAGDYEIRGTIDTTPIRATVWTDWVPVTAPAEHIVPTAKHFVAGAVDPAALSAEVREFYRSVSDRIEAIDAQINNAVASLAARHKVDTLKTNKQSVERDDAIGVTVDGNTASIDVHETLISSLEGSFAQYQITVSAQFSDVADAIVSATSTAESYADGAIATYDLSVQAQFTTVSGDISSAHADAITTAAAYADGAIASYDLSIQVQFAGQAASITSNATAIATLNGSFASFSTTVTATLGASYSLAVDAGGRIASMQLISGGGFSAIKFKADAFVFSLSGYSDVGLTIGTHNGSPAIGFAGNMLLDGTLTAAHVASNTIITDSANIGNLVVDTLHIKEAAVVAHDRQAISAAGPFSAATDVITASKTITVTVGRAIFVRAIGVIYVKNNASTAQAIQVDLYVEGGVVDTDLSGYAPNEVRRFMMTGSVLATGTGSAHTFTATFRVTPISALNFFAGLSTIDLDVYMA
jgi:hypothetical protein